MDPALYQHFIHAKVQKQFPGYGLYEGYVQKVEKDDDGDNKIFFIKYSDGDREWVALEELEKIVLKEGDTILYEESAGDKKKKKKKQTDEKSTAEKPKGRKRGKEDQQPEASASAPAAPEPASAEPAKKRGRSGRGAASEPAEVTKPEAPEAEPAAPAKASTSTPAPESQPSPSKKAAPAGSSRHTPKAEQPASGMSGGPTASQLEATLQKVQQVAAEVAEAQVEVLRLHPVKEPAPGDKPDTSAEQVSYSEVVVCRDIILMAGQLAKDMSSPTGCTYEGQLQQVFSQIDSLLKDAGARKQDIVSATIYLRNIDEAYPTFLKVWKAWVDQAHPPVRLVVEGKMRLQQALVEVSIIATNPHSRAAEAAQ